MSHLAHCDTRAYRPPSQRVVTSSGSDEQFSNGNHFNTVFQFKVASALHRNILLTKHRKVRLFFIGSSSPVGEFFRNGVEANSYWVKTYHQLSHPQPQSGLGRLSQDYLNGIFAFFQIGLIFTKVNKQSVSVLPQAVGTLGGASSAYRLQQCACEHKKSICSL